MVPVIVPWALGSTRQIAQGGTECRALQAGRSDRQLEGLANWQQSDRQRDQLKIWRSSGDTQVQYSDSDFFVQRSRYPFLQGSVPLTRFIALFCRWYLSTADQSPVCSASACNSASGGRVEQPTNKHRIIKLIIFISLVDPLPGRKFLVSLCEPPV